MPFWSTPRINKSSSTTTTVNQHPKTNKHLVHDKQLQVFVQCIHCKGSGKDPFFKVMISECQHCNGVGQVLKTVVSK